jgi:iron complex transport system substrate-binding protein
MLGTNFKFGFHEEWTLVKKIVSLVLMSVLLTLAISACGSKGESAQGSASPSAPSSASPSGSASESPAPSPSEPAEITVTHPLGTETVKKNPAKVVVFDYATLDTLDKLGVDVIGLPTSNVPEYLAKYKDGNYEDVGTLFEPDFEKLSKLKPDVIFIGGRTSEAYEELKKIAPTVQFVADTANYWESVTANAKTLGQIFGKEAEVEAEITKMEASIAELKTKAQGAGKALIVLTTGGKTTAYGPGSRFGVIHDVFGFEAADPNIEISNHGQSISNEYILEKNPDILFVIDRDAVTGGEGAQPAKQIIENDLVKKTNAYKNGKIVYLDPGHWYLAGGGLLSLPAMIAETAQAVQ